MKKPTPRKAKAKPVTPSPAFRAVFPADVTAQIMDALTAVGPGARLMVRDDGKQTFIRVLSPEGSPAALGDDEPCEFNNAHRCPPFPAEDCPGGG